ncbi:UbiA family prenyltransferase [Methanococcoides orientis]|uniref:UbiA family prenyltransferase n=1 Tax=Methanococcoides orientis TaxID=2822137 RepID=UPI001E5EE2B6|nr:UbiA family prenyltransferase [Methanococcoides orientis]UGV41688.1 UbiA family prenyltransferase [Methanococcoides orientis]
MNEVGNVTRNDRIYRETLVIIKELWNDFIYGGHLFAFGAICVAFMCSILFAIPITWDFLVIIYLTFYIIYLYDYFNGTEDDEKTNSTRANYFRKNDSKTITYILYGSIISIASIYVLYSDIPNMLIGFAILILGLTYQAYFKGLTKKITAFKNIFVSLVWAILVYVMFIYYSYPITSEALIISAFVFLRMTGIQILFDIRDIEGDQKKGLRTFPAIYGYRKGLMTLVAINFITAILLIYEAYIGALPYTALMIVPVIFYAQNYLDKVDKSRKDHKSYLFAAGEPFVWFILIFSGSMFFRIVPYIPDIPNIL